MFTSKTDYANSLKGFACLCCASIVAWLANSKTMAQNAKLIAIYLKCQSQQSDNPLYVIRFSISNYPALGNPWFSDTLLHLLPLQHREIETQGRRTSLSGRGLYPQVHQRMHDGKVTRPQFSMLKFHGWPCDDWHFQVTECPHSQKGNAHILTHTSKFKNIYIYIQISIDICQDIYRYSL